MEDGSLSDDEAGVAGVYPLECIERFPVACAGTCEHREKGDDGFKGIRGILYISKRAFEPVLCTLLF